MKFTRQSVYEKEKLLWLSGGQTAAPTSDLLRALAFSAAGTYRRVGTAYVLTDDLIGVGTRRQIIQDFEEECDAERAQAVDDAEKALKSSAATQSLKLSSFGDPLAMSAEQEKMPPPGADDHEGLAEAAVSYENLTPQQQASIQRFEAQVKAHPESYSDSWRPDFEKKIHVVKDSSVQMVIDGLDGVVATDFGAELSSLFEPEPKKAEPDAEEIKKYANLPKWTDAAKAYARRAVLCKPHTTAEVEVSLKHIAAIGFNQMWLTVFENGKARIPGMPFPLDPACDPKTDLLTYAIVEGKKKGITVCPVVSVFAWGKDAPNDLRLWTLRGEDSAQNAIRRARINGLQTEANQEGISPPPKNPPPSPAVFVDLTDASAQASLGKLFRAIAGHAGTGAIVCRALTPPGFIRQNFYRAQYDGMGFNPSLRLAFLKKYHFDPVDLTDVINRANSTRADTDLLYFDKYDYQMRLNWIIFRADALKTAMGGLFDAAWSGADSSKPALIIARESGPSAINWCDDWAEPKAPIPSASLYAGAQRASARPGESVKAITGILFLSKQAPYVLSKAQARHDWMAVQMKDIEAYKRYRDWDGVVIEE